MGTFRTHAVRTVAGGATKQRLSHVRSARFLAWPPAPLDLREYVPCQGRRPPALRPPQPPRSRMREHRGVQARGKSKSMLVAGFACIAYDRTLRNCPRLQYLKLDTDMVRVPKWTEGVAAGGAATPHAIHWPPRSASSAPPFASDAWWRRTLKAVQHTQRCHPAAARQGAQDARKAPPGRHHTAHRARRWVRDALASSGPGHETVEGTRIERRLPRCPGATRHAGDTDGTVDFS